MSRDPTLAQSREAAGHVPHGPLAAPSARGGLVTMASQAAQALLGLAGAIVVARLLQPTDYGLVAMAMVLVSFVAILRDLGLSDAAVQRPALTHAQASTLFWIHVALGLVSLAIVVAAAPLGAWFYDEPVLAPVTAALALTLPIAALGAQHAARLRREMRFAALAASELASVVVGVVVLVALAWRGGQHWALIAGRLAEATTLTVAVWAAAAWRPGLPSRAAGVGEMLSFGGNVTGFAVLNYLARNVDNLLIGRVWGAEQLGLYSRAYQLLLVPIRQVNTPLSAVAVPVLSRLAPEPERYRRAYLRLLEKIAIVAMPLAACAIVTSDWIVAVLLGPRWGGVAPLFAILAASAFLQPVANTVGWLFVSQGRTRDMLHWGMMGTTVTVAGILIGLPWGARGVALSYSVAFAGVAAPLLFWFVGRTGPVATSDFYRASAPAAFAATTVLGTVLAVRLALGDVSPALGLLVTMPCAATATLVSLLVLPDGRAALRDLRDHGWPRDRSASQEPGR